MQKLHDDLFNKGFHKLNDPELFKYLTEIDSWEWNNLKTEGLQLVKRNSFIEEAIDKTHKLIADKYIKLLDTSYKFGDECDIVNGMDDATLSWHNDNIEGYNLCVLLYIDSMDEDIGGMTRFRDIQSKEITGEFYPQKYDVSFMNHGSQFEHIVTPMKLPIDRRVALFNYNISRSLIE
jgi:hypothetical protein